MISKNVETRRCPCVNGFRRFGSGRSDGCRYAPKPPALPAAPHPDLFNFLRFLYQWDTMWSLPYCNTFQRKNKEEKPPCLRLCGKISERSLMCPYTLPTQARCHLSYTRQMHDSCFCSQIIYIIHASLKKYKKNYSFSLRK